MSEPLVYAVCVTAGRPELLAQAVDCFQAQTYRRKRLLVYPGSGGTIGQLRNQANYQCLEADIICHWDDDDWSHPNRIAEQASLLHASNADVVGYNQMLFWRECPGEAWLYTGSILGTSLYYWRRTWERTPFRARGHHSEDLGFVIEVQERGGTVTSADSAVHRPRMIARIHSGNASNPSYGTLETHPNNWRRVPGWDEYCRNAMEAKSEA